MRISEVIKRLTIQKKLNGDQEVISLYGHTLCSRDGADDTPVEPFAQLTPGQLLAKILDGDKDKRLEICDALLASDERWRRCFIMGHDEEIDSLRSQLSSLKDK